MFYYTEKLWAWLAVKSLQAKFYSMMAMSHALDILHGTVHTFNRAGLWIESKILKASLFFFKNS